MPTVIAPLAVVVVLLAVGVRAEVGRREIHAATLAIVLRHLEQVREGLTRNSSHELHHVDARRHLAALPTAHGLARDIELGGKFLLREAVRTANCHEPVCECHGGSFRRFRLLTQV